MDVDEAPKSKTKDDDLAQYNLDDYDKEVKTDGVYFSCVHDFP